MESFFQITAIMAAGISLAMAVLSLITFFYKGRQTIDLVFGLLCLSVVLFILFPPTGFILADRSPYTMELKIKRIFSFSFIALLPWFVALYTGYKNKKMPFIVAAAMGITYFFMFFSSTDNPIQLWVLSATIILTLTLAYSFYAAYFQYQAGHKAEATRLFVALGIFAFFNCIGAINQLGTIYFTDWDAVFFPVNLCPLAFIVIIGIQLQTNSNKQLMLEKMVGIRDSRWQSLLDDIQLIIVNIDIEEKIRYINPYGVSLLKYNEASELIDSNWSDHCMPAKDENGHVNRNGEFMYINKNVVITKDGKGKIINWNSNSIFNDDGVLVGRMNIGSDITNHEEAIRQIQELKAELEKENLTMNHDAAPSEMNQEVIGKSRPFIYAIQKSKQVAPTNASVLLLGETGVGKEAFADLIQATSLRSTMPFIKVNCGALPAELIEDELFGHEKGAFTGAVNSRMGRFEKANGGTIFLDEIGELPLVLQPKLLRVLQNGEFERVGGHQTIKVDVRVIAATNSDLDKEVRDNRFRDDLFYRLNVFPITIPPLRKRTTDIPLLIQHFIERKSKEHGKRFENISKADMNHLCDYEWPGNIRELKNVIERAVISSENHTLKLDWFYEDIQNNPQSSSSTASLEEMERDYIIKVLQESNWKINGEKGAAEKLVMHPNTLRSRMKKLKINVPWKQEEMNAR